MPSSVSSANICTYLHMCKDIEEGESCATQLGTSPSTDSHTSIYTTHNHKHFLNRLMMSQRCEQLSVISIQRHAKTCMYAVVSVVARSSLIIICIVETKHGTALKSALSTSLLHAFCQNLFASTFRSRLKLTTCSNTSNSRSASLVATACLAQIYCPCRKLQIHVTPCASGTDTTPQVSLCALHHLHGRQL